MKKTILFLTISFCFIVFSAIAQEQKMDHDPNNCFRNQKKNNFKVGDTLYSYAIIPNILVEKEKGYYYSSLLDSLAVFLKKDTSISLIINALHYDSYEETIYAMEHDARLYNEFKDKIKLYTKNVFYKESKENATNEAGIVKQYLKQEGVKNCMICYGIGVIKWDKKIAKNFKDKNCLYVVQIILTNVSQCK